MSEFNSHQWRSSVAPMDRRPHRSTKRQTRETRTNEFRSFPIVVSKPQESDLPRAFEKSFESVGKISLFKSNRNVQINEEINEEHEIILGINDVVKSPNVRKRQDRQMSYRLKNLVVPNHLDYLSCYPVSSMLKECDDLDKVHYHSKVLRIQKRLKDIEKLNVSRRLPNPLTTSMVIEVWKDVLCRDLENFSDVFNEIWKFIEPAILSTYPNETNDGDDCFDTNLPTIPWFILCRRYATNLIDIERENEKLTHTATIANKMKSVSLKMMIDAHLKRNFLLVEMTFSFWSKFSKVKYLYRTTIEYIAKQRCGSQILNKIEPRHCFLAWTIAVKQGFIDELKGIQTDLRRESRVLATFLSRERLRNVEHGVIIEQAGKCLQDTNAERAQEQKTHSELKQQLEEMKPELVSHSLVDSIYSLINGTLKNLMLIPLERARKLRYTNLSGLNGFIKLKSIQKGESEGATINDLSIEGVILQWLDYLVQKGKDDVLCLLDKNHPKSSITHQWSVKDQEIFEKRLNFITQNITTMERFGTPYGVVAEAEPTPEYNDEDDDPDRKQEQLLFQPVGKTEKFEPIDFGPVLIVLFAILRQKMDGINNLVVDPKDLFLLDIKDPYQRATSLISSISLLVRSKKQIQYLQPEDIVSGNGVVLLPFLCCVFLDSSGLEDRQHPVLDEETLLTIKKSRMSFMSTKKRSSDTSENTNDIKPSEINTCLEQSEENSHRVSQMIKKKNPRLNRINPFSIPDKEGIDLHQLFDKLRIYAELLDDVFLDSNRLLFSGEKLPDLNNLTIENIIFRWINLQLARLHRKRIENFTTNLADGLAVLLLLHIIAPEIIETITVTTERLDITEMYDQIYKMDRDDRLDIICTKARSLCNFHLKKEHFTDENGEGGDPDLLCLFLLNLFQNRPHLDILPNSLLGMHQETLITLTLESYRLMDTKQFHDLPQDTLQFKRKLIVSFCETFKTSVKSVDMAYIAFAEAEHCNSMIQERVAYAINDILYNRVAGTIRLMEDSHLTRTHAAFTKITPHRYKQLSAGKNDSARADTMSAMEALLRDNYYLIREMFQIYVKGNSDINQSQRNVINDKAKGMVCLYQTIHLRSKKFPLWKAELILSEILDGTRESRMQPEIFIDILVYFSRALYVGQQGSTLDQFEKLILNHLKPYALQPSNNEFRNTVYDLEIRKKLGEYELGLKEIYSYFTNYSISEDKKDSKAILGRLHMTFAEFKILCNYTKTLDENLDEETLSEIIGKIQQEELDVHGSKTTITDDTMIAFGEYLEAWVALAMLKIQDPFLPFIKKLEFYLVYCFEMLYNVFVLDTDSEKSTLAPVLSKFICGYQGITKVGSLKSNPSLSGTKVTSVRNLGVGVNEETERLRQEIFRNLESDNALTARDLVKLTSEATGQSILDSARNKKLTNTIGGPKSGKL